MSFGPGRPETEVTEKGKRRSFTGEYKQRILREAAACKEPGAVGALLRREGLYSSHLTQWRRERDRGQLAGLAPKKRGRAPKMDKAVVEENRRLVRELEQLKKRLAQAEAIIDVQKKVASLLGIPLKTLGDDENGS